MTTYLTGSIDALRLTIFGTSLFFSFFSQPTHFGSSVQGREVEGKGERNIVREGKKGKGGKREEEGREDGRGGSVG